MIEKTCFQCGKTKSVEDFYSQNKTKTTGEKYVYYPPNCKECTIKNSHRWQQRNPEKHLASNRKFYKNNGELARKNSKERNARWRDGGGLRKWQKTNKDKLQVYKESHRHHNISAEEWITCKEYFNNSCAYCGLPTDEHYIFRLGEKVKSDLHKEHVEHNGENDITNCVPSCKSCNSSKSTFSLEDWYIEENSNYCEDRLHKIYQWLENDVYNFKTR